MIVRYFLAFKIAKIDLKAFVSFLAMLLSLPLFYLHDLLIGVFTVQKDWGFGRVAVREVVFAESGVFVVVAGA